MEKKRKVKITNDKKDPKELAQFAAWFAGDPKIAVPALAFSLPKAASDQETKEIIKDFINDLSVGTAQCWLDLTGDKLPEFRSHLTGLVLFADIWAELAAANDMPFDKEKFLARTFRETAENIGLEGDVEMKITFLKLEFEQARQRLAAIAGTAKA